MYINLRHGPLGHQNTTHNTLHNIIYLLPYTAYSYEPGLIRSINLQLTYLPSS
jgi:hypothetical protein